MMARQLVTSSLLMLCIIFLCISSIVCDDPWQKIDVLDVEVARNDDRIEMYYLEAPLMEEKYGKFFAFFNIYHVALGFRNTRTNYTFTVEYDALPTFEDAMMPVIRKSQNGTDISLQWKNFGGVFLYKGIYNAYWESHNEYMISFDGSILNQFVKWLPTVNDTHPYYNLLGVYDKWDDNPLNRKEFVPSYTCGDFVFESFEQLALFGASFAETKFKPNRNYVYLLAHQAPVLVSINDPMHHQKIIDFWSLVELKIKWLHPLEVIDGLLQLLTGDMYLHHSAEYYNLSCYKFHWKYVPASLPPTVSPFTNSSKLRLWKKKWLSNQQHQIRK